MHVLFSGEGPTDCGTCENDADACDGASFKYGPMVVMADHIIQARLNYSIIDCGTCGFVSKHRLVERAKELKAVRKAIRAPGKKAPKETGYFYRNARALARCAKELETTPGDEVVAVLFRDCDGTASADRVIREYRLSDAPSVTENDWLRARASLARALQLAPGDKEIRGKIALADAHVSRIRGTARGSSKLLNDARMQFESSRDLLSKSPDPYLGLARLYVYSLGDVDRAQDALNGARKRGHEMGRREKAQLADGFRSRAERLLKEADRALGMPEEKEYLERAQKDFERAADLYRDIVPYGASSASLRRVLDFEDHVQVRLSIIREGA